jgi:Lon protease-like protein
VTYRLPLFPLNTVLFPGAPIVLHIFEERYRVMVGRCLEESMPFGVVLIRSGSEVDANDAFIRQLREQADQKGEPPQGDPVVPYSVGTTARITECHRLDDGRYYLTAVGGRRFRVQYFLHNEPYLVASVSSLPEPMQPDLPSMAGALRELYTRYWEAMARATGQQYEVDTLPEDPIELSYQLSHRLRVDLTLKQRWLEADANTRLRELGTALQGELALLPGGPGAWDWN